MKGKLLPWENKVLTSAKLKMYDLSTTRIIPLKKILKIKGPNIELQGIPRMALVQSLYVESIFFLCSR